jgi:predicted transcriptional regulator
VPEAADIETKVTAWRLATRDNVPYRRIAQQLGISAASVTNYVREGREAETYVEAFARADLQRDTGHRLREMIRRWMIRLDEVDDVKLELAISEHLRKLLADFAVLFGLNAPARLSIEQDGERRAPDPRMVSAIESAATGNREYLARIRAGLPGWPNEEDEESA